jgi:pimeloyl-ACP methyl ester carboxylesterase
LVKGPNDDYQKTAVRELSKRRGVMDVPREYFQTMVFFVFPSARPVSMPGAAHMTWFEQPDLVQQIVAAFWLDRELPTDGKG